MYESESSNKYPARVFSRWEHRGQKSSLQAAVVENLPLKMANCKSCPQVPRLSLTPTPISLSFSSVPGNPESFVNTAQFLILEDRGEEHDFGNV